MSVELNRSAFDPTGDARDFAEFNSALLEALTGAGWAFPPVSAQALRDDLAAAIPPESVYRSPRATDRTIPGPTGEVGLRVIPADGAPRAVYLHCHGGGFVIGASDEQDASLERTARAAEVTVVSVDYRLAPEHPHPAGLETARRPPSG